MRIGVISDTHGLLRPEALGVLAGVQSILHAGDIGTPDILDQLARIAPVHAVRGNNDSAPWARAIPEELTLTVDGCTLHMLHDVKLLSRDLARERIDVVIAGHSHKPRNEVIDGVLFFNPGSAGPRRFSLPLTVGMLTITNARATAEIIHLPVAPATKKPRTRQAR